MTAVHKGSNHEQLWSRQVHSDEIKIRSEINKIISSTALMLHNLWAMMRLGKERIIALM
jgi:hypothetical protein